MNRRALLIGSAATAGLAAVVGWSRAEDDNFYSEEFLQELFEGNSEDIPPVSARLTPAQYSEVLQVLSSGKVKTGWAADADQPDLAHLGMSISNETFAFTGEHVRALVIANDFGLPAEPAVQRVLFGLRGCAVASPSGEMSGQRVALIEATPDHYVQRCVIGVWDLATGTVSAFNASTVPDSAYMYAQATDLEGANMMPTGRYRYDVGTHGRRKPASSQPGAWRQPDVAPWPVRRIKQVPESKLLAYTHAAVWDIPANCGTRSPTYNNLHAGVLDRSALKVKFSSAGCQTLPGRYEPRGKKPTGAFARFRVAAGLPEEPTVTTVGGSPATPEDGRRYIYMLLTGREARLASKGLEPKRLRYGSRGDRVTRLQAALKARGHACAGEDGQMGMRTIGALVAFQKASALTPDGIVSEPVAAKLGINLRG